MPIGKKLDDLLRLRKENVNSISSHIGVSAQTIYSIIKRDNMKVDLDVLFKLAAALDVPVDYFYEPILKETVVPHSALPYPPHYTDLTTDNRKVVDSVSKTLFEQQGK